MNEKKTKLEFQLKSDPNFDFTKKRKMLTTKLIFYFTTVWFLKGSVSGQSPDYSKMPLPIDLSNVTIVESIKFPTSETLFLNWSSTIQGNILELFPSNSTNDKGFVQFQQNCQLQKIENFRIEIDFQISFGDVCSSFAFFIRLGGCLLWDTF